VRNAASCSLHRSGQKMESIQEPRELLQNPGLRASCQVREARTNWMRAKRKGGAICADGTLKRAQDCGPGEYRADLVVSPGPHPLQHTAPGKSVGLEQTERTEASCCVSSSLHLCCRRARSQKSRDEAHKTGIPASKAGAWHLILPRRLHAGVDESPMERGSSPTLRPTHMIGWVLIRNVAGFLVKTSATSEDSPSPTHLPAYATEPAERYPQGQLPPTNRRSERENPSEADRTSIFSQ